MKVHPIIIGLATIVVSTTAVESALLVDFNDRTQPAVTQTGWDAYVFTGANNDNSNHDATSVAPTLTFGDYTVTVRDTNGSSLNPNLQDRYRTNDNSDWPGGTGFSHLNLYRDFIIADSAAIGDGLVITITGLLPNQQYDGQVWSYDHGQVKNTDGTRLTDWYANNILVANNVNSAGPAPVDANGKSFLFTTVADANGELVLRGIRDSSNNGVVINGLSLTPVPEPGAIALAGLGLGFLARRRSVRR